MTKPDRDELARIEQGIAELEGNKEEYKKFLDIVNHIREFDGRQLVWIDVLYDMINLLPTNEDLLITNLDLNQKEQRIVLKTRTRDRDTPKKIIDALEGYRREGKDLPRFEAQAGPQSEKRGDKYPFQQDIRISVLDDDRPAKKSGKKVNSE